jgi:scyllo-inositol 2-dehydrogenase (NADP+)
VILAVPTQAKAALAEHFLGLGKHVLVEKPLLLERRTDAERFEALARHRGATLYTSYNHRFEPAVAALKRELDAGAIGRLYHARLVYGNGTVAHVRGSWREEGMGVVEDLAPHLLDLVDFLLGGRGTNFRPIARARHEAACLDQAVLASEDGRIVLETSYVAWKNAFAIELFGERGSAHVDGLCKWAGSTLTIRERVLPSGVPLERSESWRGLDPTWTEDLAAFEAMARRGGTSIENDWWISQCLAAVAE